MTLKKTFLTCSTTLAIGLSLIGSVHAAPSDNPRKQMSYPAWGDYTDAWTRDDAAKIALTEERGKTKFKRVKAPSHIDVEWVVDSISHRIAVYLEKA
ncbi:hypothetical protein [Alteromonas sp. KUL106]|uniref:hypothetical protein n=1 Tax=Alteromonas sp. KUL106 TaxID=2480799 RepID=UPI001F306C7E|nr:hypothetical protein [Alteromonas sp. KUL106]